MKLLAGGAMAVFAIQRLLPAQLVLNFTAMTAGFITSVKVWVIVVDLVWCSMLPLVELALGASLITIIAICAVRLCHRSSSGGEMKFTDVRECL